MRLLLDQNLSPQLARVLTPVYPGSTHVRDAELQSAHSGTIWAYAAEHGFAIEHQDADFHQRTFVLGPFPKGRVDPPQLLLTAEIEEILRKRQSDLLAIERDEHGAFLALG